MKDYSSDNNAFFYGMCQKRIIVSMTVYLLISIVCPVSAKTLKVTTDNWPPYEEISNQQAPGFSTEIIRYVFNEIEVEVEILEFPWARALKTVFRGERDALYSAFYTEERAKYCYYPTEALMMEKWVLFIRKEDLKRLKFESYNDLKGKTIGILRGASISEEFWIFLRKHGNYYEVTVDEQNFKKLRKGRLDYVVTSYSNGIALIRKLGLTNKVVPILSKVIKEGKLYIIFSKKTTDTTFVEKFSKALKKFKKTEKYKEIYKKYFKKTS